MNLHEIRVSAFLVEVQEEVDTFLVAFADGFEHPDNVLELQRALPGSELAEQDADTEMDTYCLIWNAGPTYYGGVSSCVLRERDLTIHFAPDAVQVFGVKGFLLQLELDEAERAKLREGLSVVFAEREPQELVLK